MAVPLELVDRIKDRPDGLVVIGKIVGDASKELDKAKKSYNKAIDALEVRRDFSMRARKRIAKTKV